MNKQDKQKLKAWCRVCGKFYERSRRSSQDPEFRKEIAWFHSRRKNPNSIHSKMEELDDHELDMWRTMNHPYDKTQEKTVQQAKEDKAQQAMAFNDAVYL